MYKSKNQLVKKIRYKDKKFRPRKCTYIHIYIYIYFFCRLRPSESLHVDFADIVGRIASRGSREQGEGVRRETGNG